MYVSSFKHEQHLGPDMTLMPIALRSFASSSAQADGASGSTGPDVSLQASSSSSASVPLREPASQAYMEDTPEEVFRRNLRDLQAFRRRKDTESASSSKTYRSFDMRITDVFGREAG